MDILFQCDNLFFFILPLNALFLDPTGNWKHLPGSSKLHHVRTLHSANPHAALHRGLLLQQVSGGGAVLP